MKINQVAKIFGVSEMEIIGVLYCEEEPVKYSPFIRLTQKQMDILLKYYMFVGDSEIKYPYKDKVLVGVLKFFDKKHHYGKITTNKDFGTEDYFFDECTEFLEDYNGLLVFKAGIMFGYNVAVDIRKFAIKRDKELLLDCIFKNNFININNYSDDDSYRKYIKTGKVNLFQESQIAVYDVLDGFFTAVSRADENKVLSTVSRIIKAVGGESNLIQLIKEEYPSLRAEYDELLDKFIHLDKDICIAIILRHKPLCSILPEKVFIFLGMLKSKEFFEYYHKHRYQLNTKINDDLTLMYSEFFKNRKLLLSTSKETLYKKLRQLYYYSTFDNYQNFYYDNSDEDNFYAMTDGMYGDYPDDGFDGDYEFMGY